MLGRPCFVGLWFAAVFAAASMTPSLIPRHWVFQAAVSGTVAAAGYGIGALVSHLWRQLVHHEPPARVKRLAWRTSVVVAPLVVGAMTARGVGWQRELHLLAEIPAPSPWGYLVGLALGVLLATLLVLFSRAIRLAARRAGAWLARRLPPRLAGVLGGVLVGLLLVGILDGVVIDGLFRAADETFRVSDGLVDDDRPPPDSELRSGGPGSLIAFEDLGAQGRAFTAGGPSLEQLQDFAEGPVTEPVRVYAGLETAWDDRARAQLLVEELERTGGFDRAVLAVMTTTGTGWIDPTAAAALEYLWSGDTALAAAQYSYLPSWLSFLTDSGRARESGRELFDAVHQRWSQLPVDDRPLLLVFGASLGADGAEAAFSGIADLRNRTDGVLLVGPPNFSELWRTITDRRDPRTREILPTYDGGATVRFAADAEDLRHPEAPWYEPRVVYLQHASDPIVWWSPRLILRRPDWLAEPRGPDVLPAVRWYPLVTFWQLSADLVNADRVPAGHGHGYGALTADAWVAIAAPDGWSSSDTERLRVALLAETTG